jgi:protein N-lysine methyltransferase METTL21A
MRARAAGYLDVCPISWEGKKVLDLGSGCGLTGLCVASAGAIVTMTELPGCTSTLCENCELSLAATPDRWTVKDAVWGVVGDVTAWGQVTDLGYEWDYILGADLIYSDDSTPHLMQTLLHSCRGKTEFIMSFELRRKEDLNFLKGLAEHGFGFRKLPASELHARWQAEEIGVFVIRRK